MIIVSEKVVTPVETGVQASSRQRPGNSFFILDSGLTPSGSLF
jgi:hypothetical protein